MAVALTAKAVKRIQEDIKNILKDDIDMIWNIEITMEIYQFTGEKNIQENEIAQYLVYLQLL